MKKQKILIIQLALSTIAILTSSIIFSAANTTSPTEFILSHDFSEDYFSETIDVPLKPYFPDDNASVFISYVNSSGIELLYSGLEKVEMDLYLSDVFSTTAMEAIKNAGFSDQPIANVNATSPFQFLIEHWTTTEDGSTFSEKFVTNDFVGIIAYSTTPEDKILDPEDTIYVGYTLALNQLTEALNTVITDPSHGYDPIPRYDVETTFDVVNTNEIHFGIKYTNMVTFWQKVDESAFDPLKDVPSILLRDEIEKLKAMTAGFHAATVFDYLAFDYEVTWSEDTSGELPEVTTDVITHYNIGEVSWLFTMDSGTPIDPEYSDSFKESLIYEIDLPGSGISVPYLGTIPDKLSHTFDIEAYPFDDAQARINDSNGFGFAVMTQTNSYGLSFEETIWDDGSLTISAGDDFQTSFVGKNTYKLKGVEELGFNPDTDREVTLLAEKQADMSHVTTPLVKGYLDISHGLYHDFIKWILDVGFGYTQTYEYRVGQANYLTLTQFGDWVGGEIIHDPTYSAVAAMAAEPPESSSTPEESSEEHEESSDGVPGFEILSVLLGILPVYALYRKRRR
ncbi:MAG: hypothetical protein JSW11_05920 [Candidatus Heimdallarchaeota archaeon]|nr:MAG: hypothetical protein JSW11_05920 [Candidatus Heimdallarchaeota archaeon]